MLKRIAAAALFTTISLPALAEPADPDEATYVVIVTYCQGKLADYKVEYNELVLSGAMGPGAAATVAQMLGQTYRAAYNMAKEGREPPEQRLMEWTRKSFKRAAGIERDPRVYRLHDPEACARLASVYPAYLAVPL